MACVPTTNNSENAPTAKVEEIIELSSSFYPHETGLFWEYLPDGSKLNSRKVEKRIQGPRVLSGKRYIVSQMLGRGLEITSYKEYRNSGVFFAREEGPGYTLTLTPPIKEYPAQKSLKVGASWQGKSMTHLHYTNAPPDKSDVEFITEYIYTVVDKRSVLLNKIEFEVYVINLESNKLDENDKIIETLYNEIWFSPYIGEVRNQLDHILVGGNFSE